MYDLVVSGEMSAIDAYIELYEHKKAIEDQLATIKELAILEREKYGKEEITRKGYRIELAKGRSIWNYKSVGAWVELTSRLKDIEKMAQQVATKNVEIVLPDTGEVIEPATVTYTADTLRLTYKGDR